VTSLCNSVVPSCRRGEFKEYWVVSLLILAVLLESCGGGQPAPLGASVSHATVSGNGGTAALGVTLRTLPFLGPANINILSFRANVVGISVTPSTGGSTNVPLNSGLYQVDFTKLQSDTALLALSRAIPPGTYTNMVVSLSNPAVTYCSPTQGTTVCAPGSVTTVSGGPATPIIATAPFPLVVTASQSIGLAVTVNVLNSLSVSAQTHTITDVNLGAAGVLTAMMLPPASSNLPPGALEFIEDTTGIVSSVNAATHTVTMQTATKGPITAVEGTTTIVSPNCSIFHLGDTFTCAKEGQVASVDMTLNTDGTLTLQEYDPLDTAAGDWIEGVIAGPPSSSSQFEIVTNDLVLEPSNSLINGNLQLGAAVRITLVSPRPFVVDTKGLVVPTTSFSGATDASVLTSGQTVAARVIAFSPASGTAPAAASVDFLYLRFTRVTGLVSSAAAPNTVTMQSFPPFFGLTVPAVVQLSNGLPSTNFDGITGASSLVSGQTISLRALYFGPPTGPTPTPTPFSAAKIRAL